MSNITLAIVQFPRRVDKYEYNLVQVKEYAGQVDGADIILLPEDWPGKHDLTWEEFKKALLEIKNILPAGSLLVVGAGFVQAGNSTISRGAFIYQDPPVITPYEKIFPSHAIGERNFVSRGSQLPVIEFRGIKMGACVCVDLFYPEIPRLLALQGAEVIFNPANIPGSRMDLWQQIGATRAAENTVFIAMANNTLTSYRDRREVNGRSYVAHPDGKELHQCGEKPGVYYFKLNLDLIEEVRRRWRYLEDIREENIFNYNY